MPTPSEERALMSDPVVASPTDAARTRRVTADTLIALPEMLAPSVSPDGRWVAWSWLGRDPVACVYAAPTDGSAPPRRLTFGPQDAAVESWSADSRHLILALTDGGDEKVRLHIVPVEGGAAPRLLTDPAPDYFIVGGDLHPNGRWLIYAANTDDDGKAIEATRIHRHDIETGERDRAGAPARPGGHPPAPQSAGHPCGLRPLRPSSGGPDAVARRYRGQARRRDPGACRSGQGYRPPGRPTAGSWWSCTRRRTARASGSGG